MVPAHPIYGAIDKTLTSQTVITEIDMKISEVVLTEKSM